MKISKKLAVIVCCMVGTCGIALAQPPAPPASPSASSSSTNPNQDRHDDYSIWRKVPVGTSTALLLSLGAGTLALRVFKSREDEEKE
ncbi:MAG: hypothetical protein HUK18_00655 [Bacteroidales bacterium]|nr:hypothetical protein [Bacteroidales bacterium]